VCICARAYEQISGREGRCLEGTEAEKEGGMEGWRDGEKETEERESIDLSVCGVIGVEGQRLNCCP